MSDPKDFVAGMDSNARKSPTRVVFVTRRTSAQVKVTDEDQVQTYPEVLFRATVAIEVLTIALVGVALRFNAPLEGIADPSHTPNPPRRPGTSSDCRRCCTTSLRWSRVCWFQLWL